MTHRPDSTPPLTLATALLALAAGLAAQQPPADLRTRVLAAMPAVKPQPPPQRQRRIGWAAAVCAALLVASTSLLLLAPQIDPASAMAGAADNAARSAQEAIPFLALAGAERWPAAASDGATTTAAPAWLVATEIPQERLAELGLPFDPSRAGQTVRAELLLRPSGEVLAVRVLHASAAIHR